MTIESCLVHKLENYIDLNQPQKELLARLEKETRSFRKWESITVGDDSQNKMYVVKSGWFLLYRGIEEMDSAICQVFLPGDIIGLNAICVKASSERIVASTEGELCPFPDSALPKIFEKDRKLSTLFFYVAGRDALIIRGLLTSTILLAATKRLAYFILLLQTRLRDLGAVGSAGEFTIKMSQIEIGKTISLSQHQVNRSFRELKENGLIQLQSGKVFVENQVELERFCSFDAERYKLAIRDGMF